MDLVLEAIRIHSDGFDTDNMIALALILADKLDVKKTRISDAGLQVIGNRQYAHMEDIYLKIEEFYNRWVFRYFRVSGVLFYKEDRASN